VWATCRARNASPGAASIQPPGQGTGARPARHAPALRSTVARPYSRIVSPGLGGVAPAWLCTLSWLPSLLSRIQLAKRGASDALAPDMDALGGIQLGAGEVVVVAILSAGDQHLAVGEQGRRGVRTRDVQAAG